jgi:PAS domain S-box-containing protein
MASFIDITDKKMAEQELIQANNIIEGMLNGIHDIVGLQLPNHSVVRYNKAGYEALGLSASEVVGKKCYELIGRDTPCVPCATSEAIARGQVYTIQRYSPEIGKFLECTSNPILNDQGKPELIVELLHDITSQKKAEEALRESEERFRQLFNNASDAIFLHELHDDNSHGRFIEVNDAACRALGYSHEELLEKAVFDINTLSDKEAAPDITRQLISEGHALFEGTHVRKDGSIFPVEVSAHLFELHGSRVVLSICRDITERKRSEKSIIEANRKLQLLSSITRHDILNSLGGLLLFLDSIPRSDLSPVVRENLHRIEAYALTIQKQIKFTHDYQVLGLQKAIWQDLSRCFQKASDQFDTGRITVEEHLSGIEIFADPMLEKVIYNLIDNALRYGGAKLSKIFGYYRTDGEDLIWIIEDDGAGVAPEMKDQIMERGVGCNTGFGLFLSAEILSITGMTITETGTDGEGARFEIRVPKGMFRLGTDQRPEERG